VGGAVVITIVIVVIVVCVRRKKHSVTRIASSTDLPEAVGTPSSQLASGNLHSPVSVSVASPVSAQPVPVAYVQHQPMPDGFFQQPMQHGYVQQQPMPSGFVQQQTPPMYVYAQPALPGFSPK
jgi:hypothetical protein